MAHICICMATFNGAAFIEKQLNSIAQQSHDDWSLLISDDGSTDETLAMIDQFIAAHPNHNIRRKDGPQSGYAHNFLSMLCDDQVVADYFAFADQDDIWMPNHLELALGHLQGANPKNAALYGARTAIIDDADNEIGLSKLYSKPPSFQNAIVQNIMGGNTMVMNRSARELVAKAGWNISAISHDWWVYILVTGVGGQVVYDLKPSVLYRNHAQNIIGPNKSVAAYISRLGAVAKNRFGEWNAKNLASLKPMRSELTVENQNILDGVNAWRNLSGLRSVMMAQRLGLHRQSRLETIMLLIAGFFKKV